MATAQFRKGDRVQHKRSKKLGAVVAVDDSCARSVLVEWDGGMRAWMKAAGLRKCEAAETGRPDHNPNSEG